MEALFYYLLEGGEKCGVTFAKFMAIIRNLPFKILW